MVVNVKQQAKFERNTKKSLLRNFEKKGDKSGNYMCFQMKYDSTKRFVEKTNRKDQFTMHNNKSFI